MRKSEMKSCQGRLLLNNPQKSQHEITCITYSWSCSARFISTQSFPNNILQQITTLITIHLFPMDKVKYNQIFLAVLYILLLRNVSN